MLCPIKTSLPCSGSSPFPESTALDPAVRPNIDSVPPCSSCAPKKVTLLNAGNGREGRNGWSRVPGQQDSWSRAWQAAEAEEEGDEGHGVKAGCVDESRGGSRLPALALGVYSGYNPPWSSPRDGVGSVSGACQAGQWLCPAEPALPAWAAAPRAGTSSALLCFGTIQEQHSPTPAPKNGNWGLMFASPWVPTAQVSPAFKNSCGFEGSVNKGRFIHANGDDGQVRPKGRAKWLLHR